MRGIGALHYVDRSAQGLVVQSWSWSPLVTLRRFGDPKRRRAQPVVVCLRDMVDLRVTFEQVLREVSLARIISSVND